MKQGYRSFGRLAALRRLPCVLGRLLHVLLCRKLLLLLLLLGLLLLLTRCC